MRVKALAVAAAAAGALVFGAVPADAAPYWQAVNTGSSDWFCTAYKHHSVSDHVNWKVCEVTNADNHAQVVVIVQNAASTAITIGGSVRSSYGSAGECFTSTLNPGFTRACYGRTVLYSSDAWWIQGTLTVNGDKDIWTS
ncbi:hypothetical protein OIE43_16020 [Streptomyces pseudovenezuelae]|uniref:Secreted protein n=1 Tax=Streptomyces pseudovenezuelae TaxID=67350 RepID=A0ABZ1X0W1_9ACTN|nr:hypothetical protein [Streptomyces pseudovenezuelae]WUA88966.1 hypothetical protein OHO81_17400 [Streptomyces pseudovenezuelae]